MSEFRMGEINSKNLPLGQMGRQSQVLLAAWTVLAISEPLEKGERMPNNPAALAELATSIGINHRHKHRRPQDVPSNYKRKVRVTPK